MTKSQMQTVGKGTRVEGLYHRQGTLYEAFPRLRVAVVVFDDAPVVDGVKQGESADLRDLKVL